MATVTLRSPLKQRAGADTIEIDGDTVGAVVAGLEREVPALAGWVTDETGKVRRHVNLFLNGEQVGADAAVTPTDRIDIIHAITGGS